MPATAGRVPMPRGNRMDTSASLRTTGIWANTIGYDPYAPVNGEPAAPPPGENVYEKSKGLMAMARLTGGVQVDEDRGAWKGHGRLKGFNAPGRGAPDATAAGAAGGVAATAGLVAAPQEEDESESELTDSSEERREAKKAAKKAKKAKHKKHKRKERSDSSSDSDSESSGARRKRRRKEKKHKKSKKRSKKDKGSDSSS